MSGFLLWWHREGGQLAEDELARAARTLARRGPEGVERRDAPGVHALHARFTDALGAEDDLPLVVDPWIIAADLRIDDQRRLRARLRDAGFEPPVGCTDARLLAAALQAWGDGAAERLVGDFAFGAVDSRTGRFLAARGTAGVKALFVVETSSTISCSNDVELLSSLPGVDAAVDATTVAEFLASGAPWTTSRSFRRGVERVPAGQQWAWERPTGVRRRAIWSFPTPSPLSPRGEDEIVEAFHEVFGAAVADRLRVPRLNVLLSGGLDSPAITATARRVRPQLALHALTLSSAPVVTEDEPVWAARVATALGVPHEVLRFEDDGALRHCADPAFATAEPIDEPEFITLRRKIAHLAGWGAVTLFGEDADSLLAPPTLITQLRTQPLAEVWRSWRAYHAKTGSRPWIGLRETLRPGRGPIGAPSETPRWLRQEAIRHFGELPRHASGPPITRRRAVERLGAPMWETLFSAFDPGATGRAHSVLFPFLDARVIAFVFALPPVPWCQRKFLLRRGFRGQLPDEVIARPKTPVRHYHAGLVTRWRARGGAEATISERVASWVDVARWRRTLRESRDIDDVLAAWRVFELDRWLSQRGNS